MLLTLINVQFFVELIFLLFVYTCIILSKKYYILTLRTYVPKLQLYSVPMLGERRPAVHDETTDVTIRLAVAGVVVHSQVEASERRAKDGVKLQRVVRSPPLLLRVRRRVFEAVHVHGHLVRIQNVGQSCDWCLHCDVT